MTFLKARENRRKGKEIKGLLKSTKIITSTIVQKVKTINTGSRKFNIRKDLNN